MYTYIHAYIHTYIHTYTHTQVRTYACCEHTLRHAVIGWGYLGDWVGITRLGPGCYSRGCESPACASCAKMISQGRSQKLLDGQKRYMRYRAGKDPARGMLRSFFGKLWTERYINNILFDLQ